MARPRSEAANRAAITATTELLVEAGQIAEELVLREAELAIR